MRTSNKTLAAEVAKNTGYPVEVVKDVLQGVAIIVPRMLSEGLKPNLWGLGTFSLAERTGRILANGPLKGVVQLGSYCVKFKTSRVLNKAYRLFRDERGPNKEPN